MGITTNKNNKVRAWQNKECAWPNVYCAALPKSFQDSKFYFGNPERIGFCVPTFRRILLFDDSKEPMKVIKITNNIYIFLNYESV